VLQEIIRQLLYRADARILGGAVDDFANREVRNLGPFADGPPLTVVAAFQLSLDEAQQVMLKIGYGHGGNPF
jgi:hypothetical protein